jgi:hypothetical protein
VPPARWELAADIHRLVEAGGLRAARTVNAEIVLLYWRIGDRIHREIPGKARARWGKPDHPPQLIRSGIWGLGSAGQCATGGPSPIDTHLAVVAGMHSF